MSNELNATTQTAQESILATETTRTREQKLADKVIAIRHKLRDDIPVTEEELYLLDKAEEYLL